MDMGQLGSILPLILLVVVFYFLLIRPQRKRQQEALKMQNSLAPGARVMTTTGLFATVVAVDNDDVILEVSPGIETRWVKAAIGRVVQPGDAPVDDEPAAHDAELDEADAKESDAAVERDGDQDSSTKKS
ncbi:MAG: preprotein translocase subunit YajC [Nonomuraea sp.]|nr:preprotein translocase subunit YajC [Nonomuraea sp.]NUP67205.1 preprotein translocase subunit YajC [Nonomuraea sp.]NUP76910.1 preprotein translocase subunit YajC [Nonomuraea sp.]NUS08605.1 preprotein translocase subunit YajC [Nonomuraea sp.]NUT12773.1 preprotein translocase subunit YajC [Nonomuraea sp.]